MSEPAPGRGAPPHSERGRREASERNLDRIMNTSLEQSMRENNLYNFGNEGRAAFEEWAASDEGRAAIRREGGQAAGRAGLQQRNAARARLEEKYVNKYVDRRGQQIVDRLSSSEEGRRASSPSPAPLASARDTSSDLRENAVFRTANTPLFNSEIINQESDVRRQRGDSFNIAKFRSEISNYDNVLPNHSFLVVFSPMDWVSLRAAREGINSNLTMRCDNVVLPTINLLQEQNIRRYGFGPVENVAYGVNVGDFTLQFIVDKQASIIDFFEAWMNRIVNRDSYGGADMNSEVGGLGSGKKPYEVAYKDTYACPSVNVFVYDRSQNAVLEYNIYDVFPTGIQSMNLSWSEENSLMRLNVTLSFTDLRIRPKVSSFDQAAGERRGTPTNPRDLFPPQAVTVATMDDLPIIQPGMLELPADLPSSPLVIGDGNNNSLRTFGTADNTPPQDSLTPEVQTPIQRNPFGLENIL